MFVSLSLMCVVATTAAFPAFNPKKVGGGNVGTNGVVNNRTIQQVAALKSMGAQGCRTNLYPESFITNGNKWDNPTPESLDNFMALALSANVTPLLIFEYYAPQFLNGSGFGTKSQWTHIGKTFAEYLMPGGVWGTKNGAPSDFGITEYSAFNEPDDGSGFTPGGILGPEVYVSALAGLAEGVQAAARHRGMRALQSSSKASVPLMVFPGGFMHVNAFGDCTLHGLAPYLGTLWANGTLAGVDLHTYFDIKYAPMEHTYKHSSQANLDCVLAAAGISTPANFRFTTTEFNYKRRNVTEEQAAKGIFTAIVDQFSVVDTNGVPITHRFFPWNLFNDPTTDANYGMATSLTPYTPTARGCTWARVLALLRAGDWSWGSVDPRGTGLTMLEDRYRGAQLVLWQARDKWTTLPLNGTFSVTNLPAEAEKLRVFGWDGLRQTIEIPPDAHSILVGNLTSGESYAFLADGPKMIALNLPVGCHM
eukprot:m.133345 g.133345  ORF g.133345 m.133345 type:complete len:478 (-) comp17538_c0_seq1:371-1804(-)